MRHVSGFYNLLIINIYILFILTTYQALTEMGLRLSA